MTALIETLFAPVVSTTTTSQAASTSSSAQHQPPIFTKSFTLQTMIMITRTLDVRRVYNSDHELRVSIDVPGAERGALSLHLDNRTESRPSIQIRGVLNGEAVSKTLGLPTTSALNLNQLHARLANGILDVVAPKLVSTAASDVSTSTSSAAANETRTIPIVAV
ncbi:expressed unknown protein [Seminavis robusta]|uniref:SHSP domain-containing protein n=1 Tax=Seminavis robusta TaxID=568900 RepID=A0A9N8D8S7_9STRA|nr:expressed unknown protein [Seminavis robusta]|eukprot:Sro33_g021540.1 n/a (164) ;mRNA; r:103710-104201